MDLVIKRRCCNSFALALALVWCVLVAYKAVDYVQTTSADAPESGHAVASISSFYP